MSTKIKRTETDPATFSEVTPEQISAYFLDLEGLLGRVEFATTYYQVLGVDRADGQEVIRTSFDSVLNLLFPPYLVGKSLPEESSTRIERAFQKASQAFLVLACFSKRKEYDTALLSATNKADVQSPPDVSRNIKSSPARPADQSASAQPAEMDQVALRGMPQRGTVFSESQSKIADDNRRRVGRFKLSIPVRITGHDKRNGKWNHMAETIDVSRTGVTFRLRRRVTPGTVLYITLPLPSKLRSHGFAEQSYNVYTLVRRVEPPLQGVRVVGVEFIGEHPPTGFLDKPWAVFRPRQWRGNDRRRPNRKGQIEEVRLDYFDDSMNLLSQEEARTENVSRTGLRIAGTMAPAEFDLVMISCARLKFEAMAALRSRYVGKDGFERICVQLVDKEWPARV